jgi:hypothetical protein
MILPAADELLAPVMAIDGFRLACLIDGSTGMILATREFRENPEREAGDRREPRGRDGDL